jgi:LCCL domain-containing protein
VSGRGHRVFSRASIALLLLGLLALAAGPGSPARPVAVEPTPSGSDWGANATALRGQAGTRFLYVCPANGTFAGIWGTTVYTDDSSVCTAAVQKGLITTADGGTVTIEHLPGQASYTGSTQNGVASASYGAGTGSFQLIGADKGGGAPGVKMGGGSWGATATSFRGQNGSRYLYICPGGATLGAVWGTNTYTDDSSVCTAAAQVGLLTPANGGRVTIEIRPGQAAYHGFSAHGVTTGSYGAWTGSYLFAGAPPIPGSPGGGGGPTTTTPSGGGGSSSAPTGAPTGTVLVNGAPFTGGAIPYNATVDVTKGSVLLKTITGSLSVTGAAGVTAAFVLIRGTDKKKPIVELRLVKGNFSVCPKRKTKSARRAAAIVVRQIWGNGQGSFRTRGRYAAATVRGTHWLTSDRCDGTLTKVTRGVVEVADLPKHKTVTVRAGGSYLATP